MKKTTIIAAAAASMLVAAPAFAGVTLAEDGDSKLTLGGKMFADFTTAKDKAGVTTSGMNVTRFYTDIKYKKDSVWSSRITLDINNEQPNATGLKRQMNVFLKYAYIQGQFNDAATLRFGLSHTPWIDYEQKLWQHRFVSKVTTDHYKYDDSADYGIGLKGKVADDMISYWATASNGAGYSKPNQTGSIDYNTRLTLSPIKGLDISGQYRAGYRGAKTTSATAAPATKEKLTQLLASYGDKSFRLGANYVKVTGFGNTINNDQDANAVWGWYKMDQFGVFGKLEHNKNKLTTAKDRHIVTGIDYFTAKGVTFSLAMDTTRNTAGGTINKDDKKYGIYSQFTY